MKKFVILFSLFLCVGCGKEEVSDAIKFKNEYESYNENYFSVEVSDYNLISYSDVEEVNKVIEEGTGVIYIGSPTDNVSRLAVSVLLDVVLNSGLEKVYYIDTLDGVVGIDNVENKKIPLVLFVLDGEIVKYHIGTIDDKIELSDEELILLYNSYSEGLQLVLDN